MQLAIFFLLVVSSFARAELPSIRFDRLTPLGTSAGSTVEVEIIGAEIDNVKSLRFDHPGLKAEFIKDKQLQSIRCPRCSFRHLRCFSGRTIRHQQSSSLCGIAWANRNRRKGTQR